MTDSVPILVVGESILDRIRSDDGTIRETPGGSPANVAIGLARLGHPTRFVTQLGEDHGGELIRRHLQDSGVRIEATPTPTGRTSTALARLAPDGSARYEFDLDFALDSDVTVGTAGCLHVGSVSAIFGTAWTRVRSLLAAARSSALVTYDINLRPALTGAGAQVRARIESLGSQADLVKASDEDLAALWPDLAPDQAATHLLSLGPRAVVVTLGAEGSLVVTAQGVVRRHAAATAVVDTIGAGDSFMSGLIDLLAGQALDGLSAADWSQILDHAAACAAYTVGQAGAAMPTRADLA